MERLMSLIRNHNVMLFSKSYCNYCKKVKELFQGEKIQYHAIELDLDGEGPEIHEALIRFTEQKTVPNLFIRGEHIGGCDDTLKAYKEGTLLSRVNGTYTKRDYNLVVIGGGSGGLAAAKEAAGLGRKVAVCDYVKPSPRGTKWGLGGTCVNVGCIPKKLMHKAALIGSDMRDASHFGWEMPEGVNHNWKVLIEEVTRYIKSLNFGYRSELMLKNVTYYNSYAVFKDANTLDITDRTNTTKTITADNFIVAVGGRPSYPDIPGALEYGITSDDIFYLPYCPGKTLVVGGSYVALECAGFLDGFGLDVTVLVRSILLRGFDQQMAELVGAQMASQGIKFIRKAVPSKITRISDGQPGELLVQITHSDGTTTEGTYNTVLFATGRKPCTTGMGLEDIGVSFNQGGKIIADEWERTSVPNVYAIGDVLEGKPELTPVAIQAGRLLAQRLFGSSDMRMDYEMIPTTVFTPLEYGCIGFSEEKAIATFGAENIEVYHTHFQPLEFTLPERDKNKSYGKLICVKNEEERVVGLHVLGPNAGEITQGFALALRLGAKKKDFDEVVGIHPTCAEVFTTMFITKASGISVEKSSC